MPDGSMLVVSMRDHRILRWTPGTDATVHADVSEYCGGHLNDMVVDGQGRAYAGNFGFDLMGGADPAPAALIRVDPDGTASVAAEDLLFPNGSVITPDGQTLIVGETAGARYTAFTIQDDGALTDRRIWAQVAPTPELTTLAETLGQLQFGPDGCALDAEGHIWAADEVGARCVRLAPGGGDRRRDRRARRPGLLRLHARRRRRPHAAHVRRARLRRRRAAARPTRRSCSPPRSTSRTPDCRSRPAAHGVTVLSESAPSLRPTL